MLRNALEIYDQSIVDWLNTFLIPNEEDKLVPAKEAIIATPDRPYATDPLDYSARSIEMQGTNFIVDVMRQDPMYNPQHHSDLPIGVTWDPSSKCYIYSKTVKPYLISYQIDLRTRRRTLANHWLLYFIYGFNPTKVFTIDFGIPFGKRKIYVVLRSTMDNSNLESGEGERWIRHTVSLEVRAWIFPSVESISDIPDPFGQLMKVKDIREIMIDIVTSKSLDPNDPSNQKYCTEIIKAIEAAAPMQLEHT